jgi:hypothetical protein
LRRPVCFLAALSSLKGISTAQLVAVLACAALNDTVPTHQNFFCRAAGLHPTRAHGCTAPSLKARYMGACRVAETQNYYQSNAKKSCSRDR